MVRSRAEYLINRLISNQLSRPELDEFLGELGKSDVLAEYSTLLEQYFDQLLEQPEFNDGQDIPAQSNLDFRPIANGSGFPHFGKVDTDCRELGPLLTRLWEAITALEQTVMGSIGTHADKFLFRASQVAFN